MENQQYLQEDEIYLRDYLKVVIKRRKLILAIFLVSIAASVVGSLLMPKAYEITTIISLGSTDIPQLGSRSDQFLMSKEKARAIIWSKSFLLPIIEKLNLKIKADELKKCIKINLIEDTYLIKIKLVYSTLDMAVKINNAVIDSFIAHGRDNFLKKEALVSGWLKQSDLDIKNVEANIFKINSLISKGYNDSNNDKPGVSKVIPELIDLYGLLSGYEANLVKLREQRSNQEFMLTAFRDFRIFDSPTMPEKPIMPMELNLLIAAIFGLVFGAFSAFFVESWQKTK